MTKHKHRPCPCGCGELADECMSPRTGLGGAFQLEPGDTGQAILPAPSVKDQGAWRPYETPAWIKELRELTSSQRWAALSYMKGRSPEAYDEAIAHAKSVRS